jgi:regulatory protein
VKSERSLKARALQLLAQRDQSRLELRRKLVRHAKGRGADRFDVGADVDADATTADPSAEVDALLDWLEANRLLSDQRFAESRVHAREARFGLARIKSELAQHGVALSAAALESLSASELGRAAAVRERRFGSVPANAAERAAQSRFLLGRGFAPELVQRLMRKLARPDADSDDALRAAD